MIIADMEFPDKCPKDCTFKDDIKNFGQSALCVRCPVLNCMMPKTEEDKKYMPLVHTEHYRDDWAKEWDKFFKGEVEYPHLSLEYKGDYERSS